MSDAPYLPGTPFGSAVDRVRRGEATADEAASALVVGSIDGEHVDATATVTNTGSRDGRHVVQVYALRHVDGHLVHHLVGFASIELAAGQSAAVSVRCSLRPLQRWTPQGFVLPDGDVTLMAGGHAGDPNAVQQLIPR